MTKLIERLDNLKKQTNILFIHIDVMTLIARIKEKETKETNII